jgi:hypothetical protein
MQNNGTKYTSTADVDCDEGYYIRDHAQMMGISTQTITCSKTGKWTDVPICIPKGKEQIWNIFLTTRIILEYLISPELKVIDKQDNSNV